MTENDNQEHTLSAAPDFGLLAASLKAESPFQEVPVITPPENYSFPAVPSEQTVHEYQPTQKTDKVSYRQNDLLCSLYYLSNAEISTEDVEKLRSSIKFFQGFDRELFNNYLEHYQTTGRFPEYYSFVNSVPFIKDLSNVDTYVKESIPKLRDVFKAYLTSSEISYIEALLQVEHDLKKKKDFYARLTTLAQGELKQDSKIILSSSNMDILQSTTDRVAEGTLLFPVARLNEVCASLGPGTTMTIMGPPASGKTTLAMNIAFLNSVIQDKNTLYFYLEDMPIRYQYNIFSRFTYHIGDKIPSVSLKRGVSLQDKEAVEKIRELQARYKAEKKGEIYYVSMSELSNEPEIFQRKMAKLIDDLDIDIIITDYIQRTKAFKPKGYDGMEYMNQIASSLTSLALGLFGNKPILNIMLSQLKREAEERVTKNKGRMTMFDGAEVHTIERDSFVVVGVYSDQVMRDSGEASIQLLKNRDEASDSVPEVTFFDPAYCYLGDVKGLESVYSNDAMENVWDTSFNDM